MKQDINEPGITESERFRRVRYNEAVQMQMDAPITPKKKMSKIQWILLSRFSVLGTVFVIASNSPSSIPTTTSGTAQSEQVEQSSYKDEFNSQMEGIATSYDGIGPVYVSSDFQANHDNIYEVTIDDQAKYWSKDAKQEIADNTLKAAKYAMINATNSEDDRPVIHVYSEDGTQIAHEGILSHTMSVD